MFDFDEFGVYLVYFFLDVGYDILGFFLLSSLEMKQYQGYCYLYFG